MFADDATLHRSAPSIDLINLPLTTDVENVKKWRQENGMIINENISKCMVLGTSQKLSKVNSNALTIGVNGSTLEHVDCEKLLGVYIDPSLQFSKHVDHVCRLFS